jgi:hypothetical protein
MHALEMATRRTAIAAAAESVADQKLYHHSIPRHVFLLGLYLSFEISSPERTKLIDHFRFGWNFPPNAALLCASVSAGGDSNKKLLNIKLQLTRSYVGRLCLHRAV